MLQGTVFLLPPVVSQELRWLLNPWFYRKEVNNVKKVYLSVMLVISIALALVGSCLNANAGEPQALQGFTLYGTGLVEKEKGCVSIGGEHFCLDKYNCDCGDDFVELTLEKIAFRVHVVKIDGKVYLRIIDGHIVPK
jgi:hypothetical protein